MHYTVHHDQMSLSDIRAMARVRPVAETLACLARHDTMDIMDVIRWKEMLVIRRAIRRYFKGSASAMKVHFEQCMFNPRIAWEEMRKAA